MRGQEHAQVHSRSLLCVHSHLQLRPLKRIRAHALNQTARPTVSCTGELTLTITLVQAAPIQTHSLPATHNQTRPWSAPITSNLTDTETQSYPQSRPDSATLRPDPVMSTARTHSYGDTQPPSRVRTAEAAHGPPQGPSTTREARCLHRDPAAYPCLRGRGDGDPELSKAP